MYWEDVLPKLVFAICVITTALAYVGGKFGVLNKYIAGILGAAIGGPETGFACYLTAGFGAIQLELQELSSDPNFAYTSDVQMLQGHSWPIPAVQARLYILARMAMYVVGWAIAWKIPAAPFQVPWYFSAIILGGIAALGQAFKNENRPGNQVYLDLLTLIILGLSISLANHFFTKLTGGQFNPAIAVILALSIATYVPGAIKDETPAHRIKDVSQCDPVQFDPDTLISWGIPIAISWVCPGLSVATASRCLGTNTSQITNNHQEAILEGWSAGAIVMWGTMTGKTMLGELMQVWVTQTPSNVNEPVFHAALLFGLFFLTTLVAVLIDRDITEPTPRSRSILGACITIPLLIQAFGLLGPAALIYCVLGLVIAALIRDYSLRPLLLLFIAA
jgi:hypothetical protein